MNTGMQGAASIAWKLALVAQRRANAVSCDSYHDERHPVGTMAVRTATTLTNISIAAGPLSASPAAWPVGKLDVVLDDIGASLAPQPGRDDTDRLSLAVGPSQ